MGGIVCRAEPTRQLKLHYTPLNDKRIFVFRKYLVYHWKKGPFLFFVVVEIDLGAVEEGS